MIQTMQTNYAQVMSVCIHSANVWVSICWNKSEIILFSYEQRRREDGRDNVYFFTFAFLSFAQFVWTHLLWYSTLWRPLGRISSHKNWPINWPNFVASPAQLRTSKGNISISRTNKPENYGLNCSERLYFQDYVKTKKIVSSSSFISKTSISSMLS